MRISKQKAADNRERVVASAAQLFRERGFAGVSVAQLMGSAGLTHGGFYNHFEDKSDVESAALTQVFEGALARLAVLANEPDPARRAQAFSQYCESYVSPHARDAQAAQCPMIAFAADVSRQSETVQAAYAKGLRTYLETFAKAGQSERAEAIRRFSALAGSLILARSVAAQDSDLSNEILAAAQSL